MPHQEDAAATSASGYAGRTELAELPACSDSQPAGELSAEHVIKSADPDIGASAPIKSIQAARSSDDTLGLSVPPFLLVPGCLGKG